MSGEVVAVTRGQRDSDRLSDALGVRGFSVVSYPLLRIAPPVDPGLVRRQVGSAGDLDLAVFTSPNAVRGSEAVFDPAGVGGGSGDSSGPASLSEFLRGVVVAAVGEGTASALREAGVVVAIVPERPDAGSLVDEIQRRGLIDGARTLFPCGDRARRVVPERLRECGAQVSEVVVYRTVDAEAAACERLERALIAGEVSVVTFASGSAVESLRRSIGADRARVSLGLQPTACLGASAEDALRELGLVPDEVAETPSIGSLVEAVGRLAERR